MSDLTGTAFDFIRIPIPHSQCGKTGKYRLRELIDQDSFACAYCGGEVDISSENWRSILSELAEEYKQIKIMRRS